MTKILKLSISFLLTLFLQAHAKTDKIVCYYGSWAVYRNGRGKFDVEQIDPTLCTHLIYTFVGLGENGEIKVLDAWNDLTENWGKGAFERFVALKKRNPQAKTLIAIGGWNEGSINYSNMVADDATRRQFVKNSVQFVMKYGFDGFDLDWEYPNQRGGKLADVQNFVKLLGELREEFDKHDLLLTAAVAAADLSVTLSYDVPALSKYLDFINVMTYDLHGSWDGVVGHNAPLYASSRDVTPLQKELNVKSCIEGWLQKGADPSKIILGIATYGRTFTLTNSENGQLGAPISSPGLAGPYTSESGSLGYNEVTEYLAGGAWTSVWDEEQKVPHMVKGNQWVGYDDTASVRLKAQLAVDLGLGGCMVWSLETDDFNGVSGTAFPIVRTVNEVLGHAVPVPPTTPSTPPDATTPAEATTATPSPSTTLCHAPNTYVRDPTDCGKFYYCMLINGEYETFEFHCPEGLEFDPVTVVCNYPWIVKCGN